MPRSLPERPRKIFPPPTTTTTWTPNSRTSRICSAMSCTASGSMPTPLCPPRASPLSLSKTRRYLGCLDSFMVPSEFSRLSHRALAHLKPHKAPNRNFIPQLLGHLADVFLDADLGIPFYETLIHEAIGLVKFFQFAFDDLCNCLRRFVLHLFGGDFFFLGQQIGRDLLARNRKRVAGSNLEGV